MLAINESTFVNVHQAGKGKSLPRPKRLKKVYQYKIGAFQSQKITVSDDLELYESMERRNKRSIRKLPALQDYKRGANN